MAAYYDQDRNGGSISHNGRRTPERQDNNVMLFPDGKGSMGYFFNDGKKGFSFRDGWAGWACRQLPFRVAMEVRLFHTRARHTLQPRVAHTPARATRTW